MYLLLLDYIPPLPIPPYAIPSRHSLNSLTLSSGPRWNCMLTRRFRHVYSCTNALQRPMLPPPRLSFTHMHRCCTSANVSSHAPGSGSRRPRTRPRHLLDSAGLLTTDRQIPVDDCSRHHAAARTPRGTRQEPPPPLRHPCDNQPQQQRSQQAALLRARRRRHHLLAPRNRSVGAA